MNKSLFADSVVFIYVTLFKIVCNNIKGKFTTKFNYKSGVADGGDYVKIYMVQWQLREICTLIHIYLSFVAVSNIYKFLFCTPEYFIRLVGI